jgi:hypothetical protein
MEICFFGRVAQRAHPNDFTDLDEAERRLLGSQRRYQQAAVPFDWHFSRADWSGYLVGLDEDQLTPAVEHAK